MRTPITPEVTGEKIFTFRGLNFRDIEGGIGLQVQIPETGEWGDTAILNRKALVRGYSEFPDLAIWKERVFVRTVNFPSKPTIPKAITPGVAGKVVPDYPTREDLEDLQRAIATWEKELAKYPKSIQARDALLKLRKQEAEIKAQLAIPEKVKTIRKPPEHMDKALMEQTYSLEQLKRIARDKGVPTDGTKRDIIKRLL